MVQVSESSRIRQELEKLIDNGETDIQKIYTIICEKHGVPRPTVRRVKNHMLNKMKKRVQILDTIAQSGPIPKTKPSDPENLSLIESRILKILYEKGTSMTSFQIHNYLNSFVGEKLIKRKKLTYYLARLRAAEFVKALRESRYEITLEGIKHV